jgi:hypothetical protein
MNRRRTLTLILAAAVAGCGKNAAPSAPTIQSDVTLISDGLSGIVSLLQATPGVNLSANVAAQAQMILADIKANAAGIAATATPGAQPIDAIKTAVNTLAGLLDPYLGKAPGAAALVQSALALLPVILAMAGMSAAGTRRPTMAPDQARAVLRSRV